MYRWGGHSCGELPKTEVTFGNPTTSGGEQGSVEKPYEYGDCVGEAGFKTVQTDGGYQVTVGF